MGVWRMGGSKQPAIKGVEEMVGRFSRELIPQLDQWTWRLAAAPESLEELEREIHATFSHGANRSLRWRVVRVWLFFDGGVFDPGMAIHRVVRCRCGAAIGADKSC